MAGVSLTSLPIALVFFRLMIRPHFVQTWASRSMNFWRPCSVCDISEGHPLIRTFVFARRRATLPSVLVSKHTPSEDERKAYKSNGETNTPNMVGARTQPCFTPLRIGKAFDDYPSYCTESCIIRIVKSSFLLTRSKAFC